MGMLRVIFCLVFAAWGVGQSMSMVPDYEKARRAALSITKLLAYEPNFDNLSTQGKNLVSLSKMSVCRVLVM